MTKFLQRFGGLSVQAFLIVLGAASLLVFARDGFHFFMQDFFNVLLKWSEGILKGVFDFAPFRALKDALISGIGAVLAQFGFPKIYEQPHWKQAFVLLWLGMSNYAHAMRDCEGRPGATAFRYASAFLCALLGGLMAGTVHLAHIGVLLWPVFGLLMFVGLNALWRAFSGGGRGADIVAAVVLLAAAIGTAAWALTFAQTTVFSNASPSEGLKYVAIAVAAFAAWFLIAGSRGADNAAAPRWHENRGRRMGLRMLSILSVAAVVAVLGQWAWSWSGRLTASAEAIPSAGKSIRDCADAACPVMVVIPAGRFTMGTTEAQVEQMKAAGLWDDLFKDELPAREVDVPSFALARTEVTIAEFAAFIEATGYRPSGVCSGFNRTGEIGIWPELSWRDPGFEQSTEAHPVVCVTWWDAQAYARWLSLKTGERYRLPSEAEWEYAARGGTKTPYFWGDDPEKRCNFANGATAAAKARIGDVLGYLFEQLECDDREGYTATAASYGANPFDLYDMTGNVGEWTEDCYTARYDRGHPKDGGPYTVGSCDLRVLRSGSWLDSVQDLRSASRKGGSPVARFSDSGFRLARTLLPPAP